MAIVGLIERILRRGTTNDLSSSSTSSTTTPASARSLVLLTTARVLVRRANQSRAKNLFFFLGSRFLRFFHFRFFRCPPLHKVVLCLPGLFLFLNLLETFASLDRCSLRLKKLLLLLDSRERESSARRNLWLGWEGLRRRPGSLTETKCGT